MKITDLRDFYVLDTETTGFKPADADAIEVSALKVTVDEDGKFKVVDTFDTYINPGYPLPPAIVAFNEKNQTGVNDDFLADKPNAQEAAKGVRDFIGDDPVLVGHNINFDIGFINKLYQQVFNIPFDPTNKVDTLTISREKVKAKSHKLEAMFKLTDGRNSAENPMFHNSLADCLATLDVLEYLKQTYYPKENVTDKMVSGKADVAKADPEKQLKKSIENDISSWSNNVRDIPFHMLDERINGLAVGFDRKGNAIRGSAKINLASETKNVDLAEYIHSAMQEAASSSPGERIPFFILAERNPSNRTSVFLNGYMMYKNQIRSFDSVEVNLNQEFYLGQDGFVDCMNIANNLFKEMHTNLKNAESKGR